MHLNLVKVMPKDTKMASKKQPTKSKSEELVEKKVKEDDDDVANDISEDEAKGP